MNWIDLLKGVALVIGFIGAVAGILAAFRTKFNRDVIENYKITVDSLEARMTAQGKDITSLQSQVETQKQELNVVKTLPLQQLSTDYHKISDAISLFAQTANDTRKALEALMAMHTELYGEVARNKARRK